MRKKPSRLSFLLACATLLAGCERSLEVSPGRESAIVRYFQCDGLGDRPAALRTIGERRGMRWREQNEGIYIAAGVLGTSEFLAQFIDPDGKISLYVQHGTQATAAEIAIMDELAGAFADCRERTEFGPAKTAPQNSI